LNLNIVYDLDIRILKLNFGAVVQLARLAEDKLQLGEAS